VRNACEILDEMERRHRAGHKNVKPNEIAFALAIKTCLRAGDLDRVEELMKRMEKSDTPPSIRTYTDILHYWSTKGTTQAAERCEQILSKMRYLSRTKNKALKPDVFAFNIALNAWVRSEAPDASNRMWKLYEQMEESKIKADMVTFHTMIPFFSKSKNPETLQKAVILLNAVEGSRDPRVHLDFRHFAPLLNGFLSINEIENAEHLLLWWVNVAIASNGMAGNVPPAHFEKVVKAWTRSGNLLRATKLVYKLQKLYGSKHLLSQGPDLRTYENLCREWSVSTDPKRFATLYQLRKKMTEITGVKSYGAD